MSKGTIIYYSIARFPDKNAAAHRILSNAKILRSQGYEVILVGFSTELSAHETIQSSVSGFECHQLPYPKSSLNWLSYLFGYKKLLQLQLAKKETLKAIICYNFPAVAQSRLMSLAQKLGVKRVSDITEWPDSSGGSFLFRILKWLDTNYRIYFLGKKSEGVITTSAYMSEFYTKRQTHIIEVPTLYDCEHYSDNNSWAPEDCKHFIYFGKPFEHSTVNKKRDNLKDRLDLVIELFSKLHLSGKKFILHIYGISKEDYLKVFHEHTALLEQLQQYIFFKGVVSHSVIINAVQNAHFSIFFRDNNRINNVGFPSKLAESITCGTPVITNRINNTRQFNNVGSIVLMDDPTSINQISPIFDMTHEQLLELKKMTKMSKLFDYQSYKQPFDLFWEKIGVR